MRRANRVSVIARGHHTMQPQRKQRIG
jgi:hypothetical protein